MKVGRGRLSEFLGRVVDVLRKEVEPVKRLTGLSDEKLEKLKSWHLERSQLAGHCAASRDVDSSASELSGGATATSFPRLHILCSRYNCTQLKGLSEKESNYIRASRKV